MVVTLALASIVASGQLEPVRGLSYTGIPYLSGSGSEQVLVPTHSATISLHDDLRARVESTTQFRNPTGGPISVQVRVPWFVAKPSQENAASFGNLEATWNGKELPLISASIFPPVGASAQVTLPPRSSASLKLSLEQPIGEGGYEFGQEVAAYALSGEATIGQMNLTYRYAGNLSGDTVFRLPEAKPSLGWQIGDRGAFLRLNGFQPKGEVTSVAYYPGGFRKKRDKFDR